MKVLLTAINSKYIHSNLAVYYLRAYAKDYKNDIKIKEFTINNQVEYILEEIYKEKPDVIAFSCYIWNIGIVKEVILELAKVLPSTDIWLGGPEVSYEAVTTLNDMPSLKGIICGEGEATFNEIMQYYAKKDIVLSDINGLVYRESDGNIVTTGFRDVINLDDVPFPYDDMEDFANKIIYYESSRGCPFRCSYCLSSIDKSVRFRSIDKVKEELQFFLDNKVPQVKFVDRTFNCKKNYAMEIWKYIMDNDNGVTNFHFEIAADLLDEDEIELMKQMRAGLIQLEIGVQSTNIDTIKEIDRVMDFNHLSEIVCQINNTKNVHQHLDLIAGLPYETYEIFKKSFNDVYALRPEQLQLGFLKVLKGSKMYNNASEYGVVYKSTPPYEVLYTRWITFDEIISLKNITEMVEVYYNSGQFANTMEYLVSKFDAPFSLYDSLAVYYVKNDLMSVKHSRITRYNILFDFINNVIDDDKEKEVLREILIFDLYLRENMKTRPQFAKDLKPYKEKINELSLDRNKGKLLHAEPFNIEVMQTVKEKRAVYEDNLVVFNYEKRNPLNYEADYKVIKYD